MQLVHLIVTTGPGGPARGVSVWVNRADPAEAERAAAAALAAQGWTVERSDGIAETTADDYFRPCPSQQAFRTAQSTGIAWRFDDE